MRNNIRDICVGCFALNTLLDIEPEVNVKFDNNKNCLYAVLLLQTTYLGDYI